MTADFPAPANSGRRLLLGECRTAGEKGKNKESFGEKAHELTP
jgi:hypothetical protein